MERSIVSEPEGDFQEKQNLALKAKNEFLKWRTVGCFSYLKQGQWLKIIKEKQLYRYLGSESEEFESFEMFLKSPEINMDLRKAYYLIEIWSTFVEKLKLDEKELAAIPWTSLRVILPIIRKENAEELLEKARNLTRRDLELEKKAYQSGLTELGGCHHEEVVEVHYFRCKSCGEHFLEPPPRSKIIKS